jgi:hypothetical protein
MVVSSAGSAAAAVDFCRWAAGDVCPWGVALRLGGIFATVASAAFGSSTAEARGLIKAAGGT